VSVAGGEKRGMRPAVAHRHAEALAVPDRHVRTPLAWRGEQGQAEQIGGGGDQRAGRVSPLAEWAKISHLAVGGGVLHQRADHARPELERFRVAHSNLDAAGLRPGLHHRDGLWMAALVYQVQRMVRPGMHRKTQVHRLRGRRGFVQQRGVGDFEAGQIRDHRLKVEERLEAALGNLGLIWGVCGVPPRVLQHVALDHLGGEAAGISHPDIGAEDLVHPGDPPERLEHLPLTPSRRECQRTAEADLIGDDRIDEALERFISKQLKHLIHVGAPGPDVPVSEVRWMEDVEGWVTQLTGKNAGHGESGAPGGPCGSTLTLRCGTGMPWATSALSAGPGWTPGA
jgi:hypothetical protein